METKNLTLALLAGALLMLGTLGLEGAEAGHTNVNYGDWYEPAIIAKVWTTGADNSTLVLNATFRCVEFGAGLVTCPHGGNHVNPSISVVAVNDSTGEYRTVAFGTGSQVARATINGTTFHYYNTTFVNGTEYRGFSFCVRGAEAFFDAALILHWHHYGGCQQVPRSDIIFAQTHITNSTSFTTVVEQSHEPPHDVAITTPFDTYIPILFWGGFLILTLWFSAWAPATVGLFALVSALNDYSWLSFSACVMLAALMLSVHVLATRGILPLPLGGARS